MLKYVFTEEVRMKPIGTNIIFLCAFVLAIAGCFQEKNYSDYNDLKQKGEPMFQQDFETCHRFARKNSKLSEGSEAAGRTMQRQQALFQQCMESKFWMLK